MNRKIHSTKETKLKNALRAPCIRWKATLLNYVTVAQNIAEYVWKTKVNKIKVHFIHFAREIRDSVPETHYVRLLREEIEDTKFYTWTNKGKQNYMNNKIVSLISENCYVTLVLYRGQQTMVNQLRACLQVALPKTLIRRDLSSGRKAPLNVLSRTYYSREQTQLSK